VVEFEAEVDHDRGSASPGPPESPGGASTPESTGSSATSSYANAQPPGGDDSRSSTPEFLIRRDTPSLIGEDTETTNM
jgi:hypothetical protein